MPDRCGDCKHWGKPGEAHPFRSCMAVVHDKKSVTSDYQYDEEEAWPEDWADADGDANRQFRATHKAVAMDGSGFFAAFRTHEDFGCMLFEVKPTA